MMGMGGLMADLEGLMRGQKKGSSVTRRTTVDRDSQPNSNAFTGAPTRCHETDGGRDFTAAVESKTKEGIPKLALYLS